MPSDPIERLLAEDFALARSSLETDGFSERLLDRIAGKKRTRLAAIGVAGSLGAAIAGVQFGKLTGFFAAATPVVADLSAQVGVAGSLAPQLLAAAALAIAFAATAIVVQGES